MDVAQMKEKIKEIIANVTSIDPAEIGDETSFSKELGLDSLSLLEIGVDVDYEFRLELPEERMRGLDSVDETLALVEERLEERLLERSVQAEVA
jgi:acyl carrier protein